MRRRSDKRLPLALFLVLCVHGQASAEEPIKVKAAPEAKAPEAAPEVDPATPKESTVLVTGTSERSNATFTETPWIELPQSVHTIDEATLKDWGARTPQEAWSMTSGVQASDQSLGSRYGGLARMRGIQGSQTLLNGFAVPQRMAMFMEMAGVKSIDFMKGPADALDGTQTPGMTYGGFGGQVNINSKKPTSEPGFNASLSGRALGNSQLGLTLGGNTPLLGDTLTGRVDVSGNLGKKFYVPSDFSPEWSYGIAPALAWKPHQKVTVEARGSWTQSKLYSYKGIPVIFGDQLGDYDAFLGDEDSTTEFSAYMAQLEATVKFNRYLEANIAGSLMGQTLDTDMWAWASSRDLSFAKMHDEGVGLPAFSSTDGDSDSKAARAFLIGSLTTDFWKHKLLLGGDVEASNATTESTPWNVPADPIRIDSPTLPPLTEATATGPSAGGKTETDLSRLGAMAQYQAEITPYVRLLGGVRFDAHEYTNPKGTAITTGQGPTATTTYESKTYEKTEPSYRGGLVVLPLPELAVYANYTAGHNPNFGSKDEDGEDITESMEYELMEVGVKAEPWTGLQISGSFFNVEQSKVPVAIAAAPGTTSTGVELTGESTYQGWELMGVGKITHAWDVNLSYTYTHVESSQDGHAHLHNVAPHTLSAFTSYKLPGILTGVRLGAGYRFVDERRVGYGKTSSASDPREEDNILPAYHLVDLLAEYSLPEAWLNSKSYVRLNASNLLNQEYYTVARQVSETSAGEPLAVMLTLGLER